MSYKPLPEGLTIKRSSVHGLGLFTEKDIKEGEVLGTTHVTHTEYFTEHLRTPLGGFYKSQ